MITEVEEVEVTEAVEEVAEQEDTEVVEGRVHLAGGTAAAVAAVAAVAAAGPGLKEAQGGRALGAVPVVRPRDDPVYTRPGAHKLQATSDHAS